MYKEAFKAYMRTIDSADPGVIAPHKVKYYNRYDIQWLIDELAAGKQHTNHSF